MLYEEGPQSGAFLPLSLMYFLSGEPMHDLSGVDTSSNQLISRMRSICATLKQSQSSARIKQRSVASNILNEVQANLKWLYP
jgi:hypothetical protein